MAKKSKITQADLQHHNEKSGKFILVEVVRDLGTYQPTKFVRGVVTGVRLADREYAVLFPFGSFDYEAADGKAFSDGVVRIISFDDVMPVGRHNGW